MTKTSALALALALSLPAAAAHALPQPTGSFFMSPTVGTGLITVDTGDILLTTVTRTVPSWTVGQATPTLSAVIHPGDLGLFSSTVLEVPPGLGIDQALGFTLSVAGLVFDFTQGHTNARIGLDKAAGVSGSFADQFSGFLANGAGHFAVGTPVSLAETCAEPVVQGHAGLISCTNSVVTIGTIPEPGTLGILGGALLGLGLLWRRPRSGRCA